MVASNSTARRNGARTRRAPSFAQHGTASTALADMKTCACCRLPVDVRNAKGIGGKRDDPVTFPCCEHALHAHCLDAWMRTQLTPEQRALWDRRPHCKTKRAMAFVQYDTDFGGRCEACAQDAPPAN